MQNALIISAEKDTTHEGDPLLRSGFLTTFKLRFDERRMGKGPTMKSRGAQVEWQKDAEMEGMVVTKADDSVNST